MVITNINLDQIAHNLELLEEPCILSQLYFYCLSTLVATMGADLYLDGSNGLASKEILVLQRMDRPFCTSVSK